MWGQRLACVAKEAHLRARAAPRFFSARAMAFDLSEGWDAVGFPRLDISSLPRPRVLGPQVDMWLRAVRRLPHFHRPLHIAFPCIGLDACGVFLRAQKFRYAACLLHAHLLVASMSQVPEYCFDTAPHLEDALRWLHGGAYNDDSFRPLGCSSHHPCPRLGPHGDVLNMDYTSWARLDGLIVGPPCPPWSSMGHSVDSENRKVRV